MTRWTPAQIATLLVEYRAKGAAALAPELGKSETAVRIKASRLGTSRDVRRETLRKMLRRKARLADEAQQCT